MTDTPTRPPADRDAARQARLRDALRENLKRRKSQLRGRAKVSGDSASVDAVSTDTASTEPDEADPIAGAAGPPASDQTS